MKLTAEEKGNRVFDVLANEPDGLDIHSLADHAKLSRGQTNEGIRYIRETLAELHGEPIVCDRQPDGTDLYLLAPDEDLVARYTIKRAKIAAVQAEHLLTGAIAPGMAKFGNHMLMRFLSKSYSRIVEDLNELVSISGEDGDDA